MKNKIITVLICLSVLTPNISHALVGFGGRIVAVNECFCSGGWMIWVLDTGKKVPLPLVFQFGYSSLKANYNIFTVGVSTVGSFSPGGACTLASTSCTVTIPAAGIITPHGFPGVGTSGIF